MESRLQPAAMVGKNVTIVKNVFIKSIPSGSLLKILMSIKYVKIETITVNK